MRGFARLKISARHGKHTTCNNKPARFTLPPCVTRKALAGLVPDIAPACPKFQRFAVGSLRFFSGKLRSRKEMLRANGYFFNPAPASSSFFMYLAGSFSKSAFSLASQTLICWP